MKAKLILEEENCKTIYHLDSFQINTQITSSFDKKLFGKNILLSNPGPRYTGEFTSNKIEYEYEVDLENDTKLCADLQLCLEAQGYTK